MDQAQQLWMWWHSLLTAFAPVFIMPGWVRCAPWVTGMMLCWEEQTITQILMALGLELRWRVLEHFAEYGAWDRKAVERHTLQLIEQERPAGEIFRTKTTLAVELLRQADAASRAPIIGVFDGAYAVGTVVESCLHPQPGYRRIKLLTRLRANAPLYSAAVLKRRAKGRRPLWGPRLAAPQHHLYWPTPWQQSRAWVYGRIRRSQYQHLRCRWSVSGPNTPIPCVST